MFPNAPSRDFSAGCMCAQAAINAVNQVVCLERVGRLFMTRWTPVRDVMTKKLITIQTTDQPLVATQVMIRHDIGSVVVTKSGRPVGILTDRDIMKKLCPEERCRKVTAEEIMSSPLITIGADAKLDEAVELMTDEGIRRLLVEEDGEIVGIVTIKDLMRGRRACARLCWVLRT